MGTYGLHSRGGTRHVWGGGLTSVLVAAGLEARQRGRERWWSNTAPHLRPHARLPACLQDGGWGLHEIIKKDAWKLKGIVNGIDYTEWSPMTDKMLAVVGAEGKEGVAEPAPPACVERVPS